ncbi:MAG TPA: NAD(P)/FAD-dependent oxidoreductase [Blastocatellia bacterium]|nr:NAD(P)/FAD-dependent oxidoreductase [Blastocatellia bacterium]
MIYDAIVIGAGPNGLMAAIELASAGKSVRIYEANPTIGGSARSAELTLPGFVHDICSAVHPMAASSTCFARLPLDRYGLRYVYPPAALAHPFEDGSAIVLTKSIEETGTSFENDCQAYKELIAPVAEHWSELAVDVLGPPRFPRHPLRTARFGWSALKPAKSLASAIFRSDRARAVFLGLAAHSGLAMDQQGTSAFGLILAGLAHAIGWPVAACGSQSISNALGAHLKALGGEIVTERRIVSVDELPQAKAILCDLTPRQLVSIAGNSLPADFSRKLSSYRYGAGVFKMDWALSQPVPWKAKECFTSATVHLGSSFSDILLSERQVIDGLHPERPFTILSQPTLFDPSRAPGGRHTLWGYCHVPNGSTVDMSERIEKQIERFAPGFRDCILARSVMTTADLEAHNANLVGGDINGGSAELSQLLVRPTSMWYSTPRQDLYLCSSSTPPGGGVHGLCGYHAAQTALRKWPS